MPKLLSSLQFRLIFGFAVVLALAMGSVSAYARYAAEREIERFEEELIAVRGERLERMINPFMTTSTLSTEHREELRKVLEQAGSLYGLRIGVTDQDGAIVVETHQAPDYAFFGAGFQRGDGSLDFQRDQFRKFKGSRPDSGIISITQGGSEIGTLAFTAAGPDSFVRQEPQAAAIVNNINSFLLWAGLAAGGAAIAFSVLLSRRTLSPLRSLQSAAERLGTGDLSQRVTVRRNDEIGDLAQTFNAMAEGLERAEEQRRSLMADVAHELRTPLANIQGYVEAMRAGLVAADEATIDTLHQQVLHLAHLIEDLRLLALAEAGALRLAFEPGSLSDVARSPVEAVRPRAEAKGIALRIEAPPDLPRLPLDGARMGQVVGNLLENAIQHTPGGGSVDVTVEHAGPAVRLTVADTGAGIAPEELEQVFEHFHRVDPSRTRATGGAGLGLTIAKQLVEAHGGTIRAESRLGEGSRFIVELPLA
jgi:signal transduction histidine kinase